MATFGRLRHVSDVPALMPKPVTIYDPVVRLRADMSDPDISELQIPPHFTNIQHASAARAADAVGAGHAQSSGPADYGRVADGALRGSGAVSALPARSTHRRAHDARGDDGARARDHDQHLPASELVAVGGGCAVRPPMAEATRGRVFFTGGRDLDRFVLWDYVNNRRRMIGSR